jgi:Carboxylesterase family
MLYVTRTGGALNVWGVPANYLVQTKRFAKNLGCPFQSTADSKNLLECIKNKDHSEIMDAQEKLVVSLNKSFFHTISSHLFISTGSWVMENGR